MSQRIIGRHPALDAPYGGQCKPGHATVDQIAEAQRKLSTGPYSPHDALRADAATNREHRTAEQIAVAQRKLSPHFPSSDEARERKHQKREAFIARGLMGLTVAFCGAAPFAEHPGPVAVAAIACFVGFIATCIYAGNRQHRKMMS